MTSGEKGSGEGGRHPLSLGEVNIYGVTVVGIDTVDPDMVGFSSPFGGSDEDGSGDLFDDVEEFVPENNPTPGSFLDGHELLAGQDHLDFHQTTREVFEERGVYDMTFGYNLAKLNRDTRHPDAGYRYAIETDGESAVLRAEFTPTTAFCPQSDTLTKGSFRAWNGLRDRHEYDLVRVRVDEMHQRSGEINAELTELEAAYEETGSVAEMGAGRQARSGSERSPDAPF